MFMKDLSIIVRHMRTYAEQSFSEYGLGFPEQIVLMFMGTHKQCNQESIVRYLDIDKGAVAKTINKLEAKGFVVRQVNPLSKREKLVSATERTHEVLAVMLERYDEWSVKAFEGIAEDDLRVTLSTMSRIAENSSALMSSRVHVFASHKEGE